MEKTLTFGPGQLESISAVVSTVVNHGDITIGIKYEGSFEIYCGMGNSHSVQILGETSLPFTPTGTPSNDVIYDEIVGSIFEFDTEFWFDPCDEEA